MNKIFVDFREEISTNQTETNNKKDDQNIEIRFGKLCPKCKKGKFDYDGMLNLVCSNCGYTSGGCFT
jgi:ribosomal protein S27AE